MSTAANGPETGLHRHLASVQSGLETKFELSARQVAADLEADLDLRFGSLAQRLRQRPYARDWNTQQAADVNTYTTVRSGICTGGTIWDVRRCAISAGGAGGDPFTTLANAVAILVKYTLMFPTSSSLEPQFQLINSDGPVPNDASFSRGTVVVRAGEELAMVVKGVAAGTILVASWEVEVYPETDFLQP